MATILAGFTMLLYFLSTSIQALNLAGKIRFKKYLLLIGPIAIGFHAYLLHSWIDVGIGQNLTFFNMISFAIWMVSLLILMTAWKKPVVNLNLFIYPLAAFSIWLIVLFPGYQITNTAADPKKLLHILLSVLTLSVLIIAGLQALLLVIQEKYLRLQPNSNIIQKMPAIETMETLLFQTVWLGFFLLTVVIATSWLFFSNILQAPLLQKTILAILAWLIFGTLLYGRHFLGWRGKRAIYFTLFGLILLIIIYFSSLLLTEF